MQEKKLVRFFVLISVLSQVNSAKILAHFFVPSISHQYVFQPIWKELSLRGHDVTVITPNPLKDSKLKNLTEIDVSFSYNVFKDIDLSNIRRETCSIFTILNTFYKLYSHCLEIQMKNEQVKKVMEQPENSFDLILLEAGNAVGFGLKHKFDAPVIAISTIPSASYAQYTIGNPVHPVLYPDVLTESFGDLSLMQKIDSLYVLLATWLINKFHIGPIVDEKARTYFGDDMPRVEELMKQSLFLDNVNPILSSRRPIVPNMKEFWNVHLNREIVLPTLP